jgi:hypothetical protein
MKYLLKADDMFWTGTYWHNEYPEAKLFNKFPSQREIDRAASIATEMGWNGVELEVICNYGLETEKRFVADVSEDYL